MQMHDPAMVHHITQCQAAFIEISCLRTADQLDGIGPSCLIIDILRISIIVVQARVIRWVLTGTRVSTIIVVIGLTANLIRHTIIGIDECMKMVIASFARLIMKRYRGTLQFSFGSTGRHTAVFLELVRGALRSYYITGHIVELIADGPCILVIDACNKLGQLLFQVFFIKRQG